MRKPLLAEEPRPDAEQEQSREGREVAGPAQTAIYRLHSQLGNAAIGRLVEKKEKAGEETPQREQSEQSEYSQQIEFEEPEQVKPVIPQPQKGSGPQALPEVVKPDAKSVIPSPSEEKPKEENPGVQELEPMEGGPVGAGAAEPDAGASSEMANAIAGIAAPLGASNALLGAPVVFAPRENEDSDEPWLVYETARKRAESQVAGTAFVARNAQHAVTVSNLAVTIPSRLLAVADLAKAGIDAAATQNVDEIVTSIAAMRARAEAEASRVSASVSRVRDSVIAAILKITADVRADVEAAYRKAAATLTIFESDQIAKIGAIYTDADPGLRRLGSKVGDEALSIAQQRADEWLSQRNGESSILDGPIHDNRLEAKAKAALNVAKEYKKSLEEAAHEQTNQVMAGKPETVKMVVDIAGQARTGLDNHNQAINEELTSAETRAVQQVEQLASQMTVVVQTSLRATLTSLENQQTTQVDRISGYAMRQQTAVDRDTDQAVASLVQGASDAANGFNSALTELVDSALETEAPDAEALNTILVEAQAQTDALAASVLEQLEAGIQSSEESLATAGTDAAQSVNDLGASALEQASATIDGFSANLESSAERATDGLKGLRDGHKQMAADITVSAAEGFKQATDGLLTNCAGLAEHVRKSLAKTATDLEQGLRGALKDLNSKIDEFAKKAAAQVQPRWKRIAKVLLVIVVIVAVVAITIATAGALGPVGTLALGTLLGGLAGGAIQIGNNLLDGKKWSDGLGTAIVVGMIGGLFGGVGGLVGKAVANAGLRIGLELGFDALGGIVGDLVSGNPITLEGILLGAGIGLGVTGGLKALSALKGKIKIKPNIETPTIKPDVDVPKTLKPAPGPSRPPHPEVAEPKPKRAAVEPEKPMKPHPGEAEPVAMRTTDDNHEWKLTRDGQLVRCSDLCVKIEARYKEILDDSLKARLNGIKAKLQSKNAKVRKQAINDLDAFEAELNAKVKPRADGSPATTKGAPEPPVDVADKQLGPSGKRWDDPTMTESEFIKDYKARYPNSELSGDLDRLRNIFGNKQRLNPATGELKKPIRPIEPTGKRKIPTPGDPDYEAWKQWEKYDLKNPTGPICFVAGTLIRTESGNRPIEELRKNDLVLSYDLSNKVVMTSRITATYRNWTQFVVEIDVNGITIASTLSHPYWVVDESRWIRARDLRRGMSLLDAEGKAVRITAIRHCAAEESTYNFEVEDQHNYFAGPCGVLVHNGSEDASKFLSIDTFSIEIYEIIDLRKGQKVIYVGQSVQGYEGRFIQHLTKDESAIYQYLNDPNSPGFIPLNDPLRIAKDFPRNLIDETLGTRVVDRGNWTPYEAAVREQRRMNLYGDKLINKIDAITYEKFILYRKLHNACL